MADQFASVLFHGRRLDSRRAPDLEGGGDTARYVRLESVQAVERQRRALEAVVGAWCDSRDAGLKG